MDKDAPVIPVSWRARLHRRRDGLVPPDTTVDRALADDVLGRFADRREYFREWADGGKVFEGVLAERARAYLDGEADPMGAAAMLVALSDNPQFRGRGFYSRGGLRREARYDGFADAWTAEHGLGFAAEAFIELCGLEPGWIRSGGSSTHGVVIARYRDKVDQWWEARHGGIRRMRELMAAADGPVIDRLAERRTTPVRRIVASYLVPEREDWVEECCAEVSRAGWIEGGCWLVWCSVGSAEQLELVRAVWSPGRQELVPDVLATVLERIGPAALVPVLSAALDDGPLAPNRDAILKLLAALPTDEAFSVLVERADLAPVRRALDAAAKRFPERAERLVPSGSESAGRSVPDASRDALPSLLVRPPWARAERRGVAGLKAPSEWAVVWEPGERERWAAEASNWLPEHIGRKEPEKALAEAIEAVRTRSTETGRPEVTALLHAPDDMADEIFPGWTPTTHSFTGGWIRPLIARYELGAHEVALQFARRPANSDERDARNARGALLPFRDAEVAERMAGWLARGVEPLEPVRGWFGRHGVDVVPLLVPAALGRPGARRRQAEHALRFIVESTGTEQVVVAAGEHGDAVARLLSEPAVPPELPKIPEWASPGVLPQVRLRDRATALPAEATVHLVMALAIADPDLPGVADVRAALDPASLAGFGWALFEAWREHGASPKDDWALRCLGVVGDDETVRRLVPLVHEWAGKKLHARAVKGLDVLAAIGTPVALLHLHEMRRKGKKSGVREEARQRFQGAAERAGLSADRLSERIVPGYGLDADGGMTLDYGPRRFRVGFGDKLEPYVADDTGHALKDLPEPGTGDDPELAPTARRHFTAMKAEVRTGSTYLVERLEKAMARAHAWTPDEFRTLFADHPLVRHIARRLVWTADGAAFRIGEDRTFADVCDDAFVLSDTAVVRIAHPAELGGDLEAWVETFADYEIDQPFPQLGRTFHLLTEGERAAGRMERFDGLVVDERKVNAMEHRGWTATRQGEDDHAAGRLAGRLLTREYPDVLKIDVLLQRSVAVVDVEYRISEVTIGAADPALASEAIADIVWLTTGRRTR